ncbi:molybdate ABC transporter permease subunit, partial [Xanthomonas citri pv. citri]|nr:molybdate ABC transporter permease subunit [Xanthomonas citri pv. citri]
TAALDIDAQIRVRDLLKSQLDRTNMTALIITHDVADTMRVAGRLVVLEHGRIIEDGVVSQLLENPKTAFTAQLAALVKFGVRTNSQGAESSS